MLERVGHVGEAGIGCGIDQIVELVVFLDGIGLKIVAKAQIEYKAVANLEFILDIGRQIGMAHVTRRVICVGWNSHKCQWLILQERLEWRFDSLPGRRQVDAVVDDVSSVNDRDGGIDVVPHDFHAELEGVPAPGPG